MRRASVPFSKLWAAAQIVAPSNQLAPHQPEASTRRRKRPRIMGVLPLLPPCIASPPGAPPAPSFRPRPLTAGRGPIKGDYLCPDPNWPASDSSRASDDCWVGSARSTMLADGSGPGFLRVSDITAALCNVGAPHGAPAANSGWRLWACAPPAMRVREGAQAHAREHTRTRGYKRTHMRTHAHPHTRETTHSHAHPRALGQASTRGATASR
jgi:hypothetical protein